MQDGYKNIMFDIIQRGRETIAERIVVRYRLRGAGLVDEIINLDDYLGGALPIKEKRWSIIIEEL